jgi:hypothetical protein
MQALQIQGGRQLGGYAEKSAVTVDARDFAGGPTATGMVVIAMRVEKQQMGGRSGCAGRAGRCRIRQGI